MGAHPADPHWYTPLHELLLEALQLLHTPAEVDALSISGWLNASPPHAHHQVHDHGESLYSAVYFADSGGGDCAGSEAELGGETCSGQLLLITQPEAGGDRFEYVALPPEPSTLLLFAGGMPHAVLPRASQCGTGAAPDALALRVSVACNVSLMVE